MTREVDYVLNGGALETMEIGDLVLPKESAEARRCLDIVSLLKDYADRSGGPKTLSIAVFGPPGSGKSFAVEEIAKSLKGKYAEPTVVNLSQLSKVEDMIGQIRVPLPPLEPTKQEPTKPIPIIFFDEFDTPLDGKALGWLRLFLALMQDGKYLDGATSVKFGKAVFVFAGGTASSLSEFEERAKLDEVAYREKKVPDFISRLRSFIDVKGVNDQDQTERQVRRALALRNLLFKRWGEKGADKETVKFDIQRGRVQSLLSHVHFIHGFRSMVALVEMSTQQETNGEIEIPNTELTKLHVGRGALDGKLVGISAGLEADKSGELLAQITSALLREGAKLAYGGDFQPNGTLHRIVEAADQSPKDFFAPDDKLVRNYLGFPSSLRKEVMEARYEYSGKIEFNELMTLFPQEIEDLNLPRDTWFPARPVSAGEAYQANKHLAWAISLFRLRVRLIQDIDALIVFGGKDGESWGRFSGVAEEVMLALAFRKPVYILGGLGGAASEVGKLLGLGQTIANPDECLSDLKPIKDISSPKFGRAFAIANLDLPETIEGLRDYLFSHSITAGGKWPWNGLEPVENMELFRAAIDLPEGAHKIKRSAIENARGKCVDIIVKGLSRLEWKKTSSRHS